MIWYPGSVYTFFCPNRLFLSILSQTIEIARTAAWAMSNLARGGKTPGKPFLSVAPSIIAALRGDYMTGAPRDESLRVEAAWILAFLTAKENETVTELMRHGVVPALVEALVGSGGEVRASDISGKFGGFPLTFLVSSGFQQHDIVHVTERLPLLSRRTLR